MTETILSVQNELDAYNIVIKKRFLVHSINELEPVKPKKKYSKVLKWN